MDSGCTGVAVGLGVGVSVAAGIDVGVWVGDAVAVGLGVGVDTVGSAVRVGGTTVAVAGTAGCEDVSAVSASVVTANSGRSVGADAINAGGSSGGEGGAPSLHATRIPIPIISNTVFLDNSSPLNTNSQP
jgi:hypothetical protein